MLVFFICYLVMGIYISFWALSYDLIGKAFNLSQQGISIPLVLEVNRNDFDCCFHAVLAIIRFAVFVYFVLYNINLLRNKKVRRFKKLVSDTEI